MSVASVLSRVPSNVVLHSGLEIATTCTGFTVEAKTHQSGRRSCDGSIVGLRGPHGLRWLSLPAWSFVTAFICTMIPYQMSSCLCLPICLQCFAHHGHIGTSHMSTLLSYFLSIPHVKTLPFLRIPPRQALLRRMQPWVKAELLSSSMAHPTLGISRTSTAIR